MNGDPAGASGSTGWYCAATLTLTVRCRASGSASITSTTHSGRPRGLVGLLDYPVTAGPVEVPHLLHPTGRIRAGGNTVPNSTGNGPRRAIRPPQTIYPLT